MESSSSSSSLAAAANTNSTSSATSELFICFTSRLSSSSSMKLSSKSILSPGRARDSSQISLSSSLSRRLKNSGSLKGGQASPMFPTAAGKKRSGCAFENPEPSSPKVTCIGQVRVKTKKQGKKIRSRSAKRRSNNGGGGGGEASFRRMEKEKKNKEEEATTQKLEENRSYNNSDSTNNNHHNQKWVTICEALRAFGAEFNCFLPCRSSCTTAAAAEEKENGKADKRISTSSANGRSCGAVFARWLVALQDGEGKRREIELVVGEDEEEREREERERSGGKSLRRRVFEGIEFNEEEIRKSCKDDGEGEEEEEKARVSICIPPKNALLLMRCRSDPVKMAALANRFWDPPQKDDGDEEDEDDDQEVNHEQEVCEDDHHGGEAEAEVEELAQAAHRDDPHQQPEMWECERKSVSSTTEIAEREEDREESEQMKLDRKEDVVEEAAVEETVMEDENEENPKRISTDDQVVVDVGGLWDEAQEVVEPAEEKDWEQHQQQEDNGGDVKKEEGEEDKDAEEEEEKKQELDHVIQSRQGLQELKTDLSGLFSDETFVDLEDEEKVEEEEHGQDEEDDSHCQEEKQKIEEHAEEEVAEGFTEEEEAADEATEPETREEKTGREVPKEEREMGSPGLPDCLLLMMCEPKLSMEVSKETWVCSTDFIRWLPDRRRVNPKKAPEEPKKRPNAATAAAAVDGPLVMQPPRSSCSFPVTGTAVPESMASVIEQKLVGTKPPYEPFVLTRCKSEPMRSAAKLAPDACFWKNRKLEPHRPATLGVGAAGVGF